MRSVLLSAGVVSYRDSGSGEPLVFVHGALASGTLWRDVMPILDRDFRCIVPDWPLGSHSKAMRADADLSPPALARLILEFCDALSLENVTFIGNDTGGALCQLIGADYPDRVGRLVLTPCDAYDNFPPSKIFRLLNLAARLPLGLWYVAQTMRLRVFRQRRFAFGHLARHPIPAELADGWFGPLRHDPRVRRDFAKVLRNLSSSYTVDAATRLGNLAAPALVIWSKDDPIFPYDHALRLTADLGDARLAVIDDSYGFVPLDQPVRLAELIAKFVVEPSPLNGASRERRPSAPHLAGAAGRAEHRRDPDDNSADKRRSIDEQEAR